MAKKKSTAVTAGEHFRRLVKADPGFLKLRNETKAERLFKAKGLAYRLRRMLERQANRWREETGTEPPDLTSLEQLEELAASLDIPYSLWGNFTAGELFDLGLARYRVRPASTDDGQQTTEAAKFLGNGRYQVGSDSICLDGSQANVLQALVEMHTATLGQLIERSGVSNPSVILRTIRERHGALAPHILLPGSKGRGGYSTTILNSAEK